MDFAEITAFHLSPMAKQSESKGVVGFGWQSEDKADVLQQRTNLGQTFEDPNYEQEITDPLFIMGEHRSYEK